MLNSYEDFVVNNSDMSITIIANEHILTSKHITFKYIIIEITIIMILKVSLKSAWVLS